VKHWQKNALIMAASGLVLGGLLVFFWPKTLTLSSNIPTSLPAAPLPIAHPGSSPNRARTNLAPPAAMPVHAPTAPLNSQAESRRSGDTADKSSLWGSDVDGAVSLNPDGKVRLNLELRRLFDYYLSRAGELEHAQLLAWIEAQFDASYAPAVAAQLKILLANYLSYGRALNAATVKLQALTPAERLAAMIDLRGKILGADMAAAFFAHEQSWDQFTIDRLALAHDSHISAGVRRQREQELIQQLPAELAQNYGEQLTLDAKLAVALPDAETARYAARAQLFGAPAAERFSALEQSQAEFEGRVRRYLTARDGLHTTTDTARAPLRTQFFSPSEAARVAALEAIGQEAVLLDRH
jgi:lipase chaperone LimK